MNKTVLLILIGLTVSIYSKSQNTAFCTDEDSVRVIGGSSVDWFAVREVGDCEDYRSQSTCDARIDCVWLIQICVPNEHEDTDTLCGMNNTHPDCQPFYDYGCAWIDGECILIDTITKHYRRGDGNAQLMPYAGAKFLVVDNEGELSGVTVSDLDQCASSCATSSSIDIITCNAYMVPSGDETYTTSGIYNDTIPNSQDCDSIITINLSINSPGTQTATVSNICSSGSAEVFLDNSKSGVQYSLQNEQNETIDGPFSGTAGGVTFNTPHITSSSDYQIVAEADSNTTLLFDGIDDRVSVNGITLDSSFTIELWAKRASSNTEDFMVSYGQAVNNGGLHIGYMGNGELRFAFFFNDINLPAGAHSSDGLWHHYAFVYDDVNLTKSIYIDGVLEMSSGSNDFTGSAPSFTIGASLGNSALWDGNFDELKIWGKPRSDEEIQASATECVFGSEASLIAYFNFDKGSNSSVLSNVTGGPDGTLINMDNEGAWREWATINGCQSFCVTQVTAIVNQPTSSSVEIEACDEFESPSGMYTWTNSGVYADTIPNQQGCDSVIFIGLTINNNTIDTSVTINLPDLISNEVGATYQWIDCNDGGAVLIGETKKNLTVPSNGSYAVEITKNVCVDTSECHDVIITSVIKNEIEDAFQIFPNPTTGQIILTFEAEQTLSVKLKSIDSRTLQTINLINQTSVELQINEKPGVYLLEIVNDQNQGSIIRVVKE